MKEIGQKLRETRLSMDISVEEAAGDLKLSPSQIESIEEGNIEVFKDIFYLKYFIRDYSKYLGLNYEDMIDEFNEYLFDYTSKISIEDIKRAKDKIKKEEAAKIKSPYTLEPKKNINILQLLIILLIISIVGVITYFILRDKEEANDNLITINYAKQEVIL